MNNKLRIGACIMVHNMAPFIKACIESLQWVDEIFIYDDHSTDGSLEIAIKQSKIPIKYEISKDLKLAFESSELKVRNYIIHKSFQELNIDVLLIADADELFSSSLRQEIEKNFNSSAVDSAVISTWHLYDSERYLHFWETKIDNSLFVDPHTRIIKKGKIFTPLFKDGSHPIIETDKKTIYLSGPYHFHLKYYEKSTLPNYSLNFLPKRLDEKKVKPYIRTIPFNLPDNIKSSIQLINWESMPHYKETPHYSENRVKLSNPKQALIHPKDYPEKKLIWGKDILLFYEKHKWDFVENYSKRSISGFYAWYTLLVKALRHEGYIVHENDYTLALANPKYPVGIVGTPEIFKNWDLPNPAIIGPSMYDNPVQNPSLMKNKKFRHYLLTCEWLKKVFEKTYGKKCILWYAGISLDEWPDTKKERKSIDVIIYNKIRWGKESVTPLILGSIKEYLNKNNLKYFELPYGNITHAEYKDLLKKSKSMIFLCEHETQGIAYQEALASNIPIIAWDHGWWTDPVWQAYSKEPIKATSVPLFSNKCGEKFKMASEFPNVFEKFWKNIEKYKPRKYVEKEISFRKSAKLYTKYYFKK